MTNAAGDGSWDAPAGDDWSAPAAQPILGMAGKMFFFAWKLNSEFTPEKWWLEDHPFLLGFDNFSGANC